jgi:hypothetical protein
MMPFVFDIADETACELEECVEAIDRAGFDPRDEGSLTHAAHWLRRLGNNRSFLGDMLVEELKARHRADDGSSSYGAQVVMLARPGGEFFMRANIWPADSDHMLRASGRDSFVYELPHDHNFDFLTVGYFGPGYWSDYYEFDYAALDGWKGEPAGLRFIETSRLEPGKLMHYRAHLDVHRQLPPDELSVSLNILHIGRGQGWFDQYRFDTERNVVGGIVNEGASECLIRIAAGLGGGDALDLADRFARHHPSDRMRLAAWEALAGAQADGAGRDSVWRRAEVSGSRMVAMEAKARRVELA